MCASSNRWHCHVRGMGRPHCMTIIIFTLLTGPDIESAESEYVFLAGHRPRHKAKVEAGLEADAPMARAAL